MGVSRSSPWFRIPLLGRYLRWLDSDAPTGEVDRYPLAGESGETSVPGVFVVGDLTGIPLLKFAADSGHALVQRLLADAGFEDQRQARGEDAYDLVIAGAGIAGLSAALAAQEAGLKFVVIEGDRPFGTIRNFPAGKPILAYPLEAEQDSELKIEGETKEALLERLVAQIEGRDLPLRTSVRMTGLSGARGHFEVQTDGEPLKALRVVLAIGKSGEARRIGAPGEDLPKVQNRLIDPAAFAGQRVLVVGGGDAAVEVALLVADAADTEVTLSYRGAQLTRPRPENLAAFEQAAADGRVRAMYGSTVAAIREDAVDLRVEGNDETVTLANDAVLTMIGRKLPLDLLRACGVAIEAAWSPARWVLLAALLLFTGVLYFGKVEAGVGGGSLWENFTAAPGAFAGRPWNHAIQGLAAWLSLLGLAVTGLAALGIGLRRVAGNPISWQGFKTAYFTAAAGLCAAAYLAEDFAGAPLLGKGLGYWYTLLYSLTILVFGLRRIAVRRSRYITVQTSTLIAVQILALFLLPEHLLPWMGQHGWLGDWAMQNLFPGGSYWRAYGLVLAWPLFFANLLHGEPTTVWLAISLVQSFVIIPLIVWRWGKGAYCGWICSCGGLAETLGDEYRNLAPHGPRARDTEHWGQLILLVVSALTVWNLAGSGSGPALDAARGGYKIVVDIVLAGVLGLGVYFFLGGRVWCRFFCPLAALMHIYTRFSRYRIFSDKKKCISCGLCSRTCHMGIDVMNYANKGRPMDDYECVRCSACVQACPVSCLNFGQQTRDGARTTTFGLREEKPEHRVR